MKLVYCGLRVEAGMYSTRFKSLYVKVVESKLQNEVTSCFGFKEDNKERNAIVCT